MFLPGTYSPGSMPDAALNFKMLAWDTTFACWMESDGSQWRPTKSKLVETFNGNTDASGNVTFTFAYTYSTIPNVQPVITNQLSQNQSFRITSISTTAVTIKVEEQAAINVGLIGLIVRLGNSTNVLGANVAVLVTER